MPAKKSQKDEGLEVVTDEVAGVPVETTRTAVPEGSKLQEDSPTTDAGQVHPAVGNPAPVTQEGRDIRDDSQHMQALITELQRTEAELSPIQKQKLENHPEIQKMVDGSKPNAKALIKAMQEATTDQERRGIIDQAEAYLSLRGAVALLREPEDPHADPNRDRPAPKVRVDA
jgi:hypothetical protein